MIDSQFSNQKVFVTGASGFIGSHLISCLCQNGAEVHALSRVKRSKNKEGLHWWQGDLAEPKTAFKLLKKIKPELIIHLASHVVGARDLNQVLPTFQQNLYGTVNLMTGASEVGCRRIILAGSLEEPSMASSGTPSSPYAAAKWASSGYARMFHALYQLPVVVLRLFMVYGPAQQDLKKLIPYVILSLLRKQVPKMSSGAREVDWIYIDDVVNAFLSAGNVPNLEGKVIEIGSGKMDSIRTIVEQLYRLIDPKSTPLFGAIPERPQEQVRVADSTLTHALMGWAPTIDLKNGLKQTVEWYKHQMDKGTLFD